MKKKFIWIIHLISLGWHNFGFIFVGINDSIIYENLMKETEKITHTHIRIRPKWCKNFSNLHMHEDFSNAVCDFPFPKQKCYIRWYTKTTLNFECSSFRFRFRPYRRLLCAMLMRHALTRMLFNILLKCIQFVSPYRNINWTVALHRAMNACCTAHNRNKYRTDRHGEKWIYNFFRFFLFLSFFELKFTLSWDSLF